MGAKGCYGAFYLIMFSHTVLHCAISGTVQGIGYKGSNSVIRFSLVSDKTGNASLSPPIVLHWTFLAIYPLCSKVRSLLETPDIVPIVGGLLLFLRLLTIEGVNV